MKVKSHTRETGLLLPDMEIKRRLRKVFVSGRSSMPDPGEYYNNFANILTDCYEDFKNTLFVEFYLDYINTGSSKWLAFVIQYLSGLQKEKNGMLEVIWKYDVDDEKIFETGEILKSYATFSFELKAVDNIK